MHRPYASSTACRNDGAALQAEDLVQIEEQAELDAAGRGRALRPATARIARDVGDECQP